MKKLRVIHWGTEQVGREALRAVLTHPQLELVGHYAYVEPLTQLFGFGQPLSFAREKFNGDVTADGIDDGLVATAGPSDQLDSNGLRGQAWLGEPAGAARLHDTEFSACNLGRTIAA